MFAELRGEAATGKLETLSRIGFRRSQNVVYRPSCEHCRKCVSVRVVTRDYMPTRGQRRLRRKHSDLDVGAVPPRVTSEQFALLRRYIDTRHPIGGMADMNLHDFTDMVERTPVDTLVIEYREPPEDDRKIGRLVGVTLTDQQSDGLSMVYSFYDPDLEHRSGLGTFMIVDHVLRAKAAGLPYVYLGYWVEGCQRMEYKRRFRPLQILDGNEWKDAPPLSSR